MKLLLESEAAEILRCSREKVKRLRLSGRLAYLPGRPVLIDEKDLIEFISQQKAKLTPPVTPTHTETVAEARRWAMRKKLLRRVRDARN